MRTTLFLSAALAAVNFSYNASAVEIFPVSQRQFDSELAQIQADVEAGWRHSIDGVRLPATVAEVWEIMEKGHEQTDSVALRKAIIDVLKAAGAGKATEADPLVTSWLDMARKISNIKLSLEKDGLSELILRKQDAAIRSIIRTLEQGNEGQAAFELFLRNQKRTH